MIGIILGLVLLMVLAYKGYSIIWIAPVCALVVALFGGLPLLPAYTETYMNGFTGFTKLWFPTFMLGAIFGKLMDMTGAANSVAKMICNIIGAKRAILAVVIGCIALTYGGVSLFVVAFAMYPFAVALYREANISLKLAPGAIALGAFGLTMTALPGSPQIQNLIPMQYFGTTPMAAPVLGIVASLIMGVGGYFYLLWRQKKLEKQGFFFQEPSNSKVSGDSEEKLPNAILSILPLIVVVVTLNLFKLDVVIALLCGIGLCMILNYRYWKKFTETVSEGANGSVLAIINTSAAVGFGAVVKAVPGFQVLTSMLLGIKGSPLISEAVAVNVLAGATGSASGGMGIALEALGAKYMELAATTGISPEVFHRVASISSGGLDTLPHNGAVLTLLAICGLKHKDSYIDIFVTCCILPMVAVAAVIILASFGIV